MKFDRNLYIEHLQGMVRIPTVSVNDPEKTNVEAFQKLHAYLEEAYPLVHKTMSKEIIGKAGLVLHWKGTGKSGKLPLLVMAHQDVVPEGNAADWKYPPYSGTLDDDGILWSRGTTDCKNVMQAELDALELLISEGFVPDYDIYACFGYNEEIMGGPGAACQIIADEFKKRKIEVGMVIDEGGGIFKFGDVPAAHISVAEKGYADHEFYVEDEGGHAAMPPVHNALGKLGYAMWLLEENPMEPVLTEPAINMMKAESIFAPEPLKTIFSDPEAHWEEVKKFCSANKMLKTLIYTTTTPTMASASAQSNILPERASVITNSRLLPCHTLDDLMEHFKKVLPEGVKVRLIKGHNPPKPQSTDTEGYRLLQKVAEDMYPGARFVPTMIYGGTDSRYYTEICPTDSVYRYVGAIRSSKSGGEHKVDEHIDTSVLEQNVEFFTRIFQGYSDIH